MANQDHLSKEQTQGTPVEEHRGEDHPFIVDENDPTMLIRPEVRKGSRLGDERVRFVLPARRPFRRLGTGRLEATEAVQEPRTPWERVGYVLKRTLIGAPIASEQAEQERLTKFNALAVLSSDAISSVAYATEAILISLVAAGSGNLGFTLPISLAIVALLGIVAWSYRQTIPAYPNGGGSYIVAKDNLGTLPGLVAAASLMIDYVLTVSVSVSAGVQALATLYPVLSPTAIIVSIDVFLVLLIMLVNLRGVRESGSIFAIPTYIFIGSALLLIAVGSIKAFLLQHQPLIGHYQYVAATEPLSLFLLLKSFAAGCSAMTGVEAISNGVPAFKKPEPRNAAITLTWMAVILGTLFIGISVLATSYHVEANPAGNPTVIGQIAQQVFSGPLFFLYPVFQIATLLILTLAANTSYSDFPRLASLLARDDFLPHQFAFRGDRLAFSTGIVFLAALASLLLVVFRGNTTQLINLYAVGVFLSFTLSQSGMVRHWWRLRREHAGWQRSLAINGLGAVTTLLVALVIASTKFVEGAWIVVLLIPLLIVLFLAIHHHYERVEGERVTDIPLRPKEIQHRLLVPIATLNLVSKQSVAYARSISSQVRAVHVAGDGRQTAALRTAWDEWQQSLTENERVPLDIITPDRLSLLGSVFAYVDALQTSWSEWQQSLTQDERVPSTVVAPDRRSVLGTLLTYIDATRQQYPDETLTVVLPETATLSLVGRLLSNRTILGLKTALFFRPEIVVTNVSLHRESGTLPTRPRQFRHRVLVPIAGLDRASVQSLAYARSMSPRVIAAHVAVDAQDAQHMQTAWQQRFQEGLSPEEETHLVLIDSPYRALERPLLAYIETVRGLHPEETLTVILPEFVVVHWWEYFLHNQTALRLKAALLTLPGIVVTDIPEHLRRRPARESA
jgi:amino acid transporter